MGIAIPRHPNAQDPNRCTAWSWIIIWHNGFRRKATRFEAENSKKLETR
jgi:hypothetical protein